MHLFVSEWKLVGDVLSKHIKIKIMQCFKVGLLIDSTRTHIYIPIPLKCGFSCLQFFGKHYTVS